jgi:transcriptional regulator with XRE-family HTH domain
MTNFVDIINKAMNIGEKIKKVREAKGFSQKQVAVMLDMDQSQYSKIENGKTDPTTSTLEKIAKTLGVDVPVLFASDDIFKDVNSADKTLMEKIRLIEQLDDKERVSIYNIVDSLFAKKKMKDTLSSAINMAS